MDERLVWRERQRRVLQRCGIFDVCSSERVAGDGREGRFTVLEAPGWVNVVAPLPGPGERFLMVRQYRQGIERTTVEFPAGLVEPGEEPAQAAARELEEETGRQAGRWNRLGALAANPAFMTNWCTTYCAEELSPAFPARPDALERLEVLEVPLAELLAGLGGGELVNPMTVAALFWYLRYRARW
jgi:8-oxo-dGTP pyrophosphatase MutT (NUDIX family)